MKDYIISIDTLGGIHLGSTSKFQKDDGSKYAIVNREEILHNALVE